MRIHRISANMIWRRRRSATPQMPSKQGHDTGFVRRTALHTSKGCSSTQRRCKLVFLILWRSAQTLPLRRISQLVAATVMTMASLEVVTQASRIECDEVSNSWDGVDGTGLGASRRVRSRRNTTAVVAADGLSCWAFVFNWFRQLSSRSRITCLGTRWWTKRQHQAATSAARIAVNCRHLDRSLRQRVYRCGGISRQRPVKDVSEAVCCEESPTPVSGFQNGTWRSSRLGRF
ncbi:hypothetical protein IWZ00DRAFT_240327 [Phyllosticta capitalensis]|uniref:Secreted protein n=1 Tax=Phyllosticta capitalensis TaxID=121624 RepID=A0ABR1YX14_9PEZI